MAENLLQMFAWNDCYVCPPFCHQNSGEKVTVFIFHEQLVLSRSLSLK
jgi:hypothetical protein